jgi:hypothetical protein
MVNKKINFTGKKIKEVKNVEFKGQHNTKFFVNKKQLIDLRFKINERKGMTQPKFEQMVKKVVQKMKPQGNFMIVQKYNTGWRGGAFNKTKDNIDIFDPAQFYDEQYDARIYEFSIILQQPIKKAGGYNEHNDCLWICFLKAFGKDSKIPHYDKPWKLKKALRLDRDELVPVEMIPELEDKMEIKINVQGDEVYTSTKQYTQEMTIKLVNGHYTLKGENKELLKGQAYTEKEVIVYQMDNDKGEIKTYDGIKYGRMTMDDWIEIRNHPISSKYMLIKTEDNDLKAYYDKFNTEAEVLKDMTDGAINLFTCGKDKLASLKLFHNTTRTIHPDEIQQDEAMWIDRAMMGGIIYAEKTELDDGYSYDVNSMYPYIMSQLQFPITRGEFLKLNELKDIVEYGIYRIKIFEPENKNIKKLFRFNHRNYYTHIDIKRARELNLKMELIQDNQPNCLRYIRGRLSGKKMFGQVVDYLYELKKNQTIKSRIKSILNRLWGALCEREVITNKSKPEGVYLEDVDIQTMVPFGDGYLCEYIKNEKMFRTNYARVGCFITAGARSYISKLMQPIQDRIVRIHTDGFITNGQCDFELTDELGGIKNDKKGKCNIKNSMVIEWN